MTKKAYTTNKEKGLCSRAFVQIQVARCKKNVVYSILDYATVHELKR